MSGSSVTVRRPRPAAVLLSGCLLFAGCYAHVPVDPERVAPPARVRAHISPEASARIAPMVGGVRTALVGRLVEVTPQGYYLDVTSGYVDGGMRAENLTQRLLLEREEVLGLERRQLDRTRTALVAGAGAVAVGALLFRALTGETGETLGGRPSPGPPEARLPLWSIPLPWHSAQP